MKKYELKPTDLLAPNGKPLFRVVALRDVRPGVPTGSVGGLIEREANLSHDGDAWVSDNAQVYDSARVYGDAQVYDSARVYGDAQVYDSARVYGDAQVSGGARVYDNARVSGSAQVSGDARVYGSAWVSGSARVYGSARVSGGWAFATKRRDWNVTELAIGDYVTLVKDYVAGEPDPAPTCEKVVTIDGVDYRLVPVAGAKETT